MNKAIISTSQIYLIDKGKTDHEQIDLPHTPITCMHAFDNTDVVKSAALSMSANMENSTVATGLEKISFHSNP